MARSSYPSAGPSPSQPRGHGAGRRDELVMATNNSSIVSKRSVERLYYSAEPQFFRFFVRKFQRRAPLINRGYHLRMQAIDAVVRSFLEQPSRRPKAVVNLGCGSDVLPWQSLVRYPKLCRGVKFIDIDFPELMLKKRDTVVSVSELRSHLSGLVLPPDSSVLLRSDEYVQIGCDLRDIAGLDEALASVLDPAETHFLFVAEVSITYMETEAADALIAYAGGIGQAEFCLLEQILPDGPSHPFAATMLDHFQKLSSPLKSILAYPSLGDQECRFLRAGWTSAKTWSLWDAWRDDFFFSPEERRRLDSVEPFDEWEEFALFASHYLILWAKTSPTSVASRTVQTSRPPEVSAEIHYSAYRGQRGARRFAAPLVATNVLGQELAVNLLGLGTSGRLQSCDVYVPAGGVGNFALPARGPSGRMCHTVTDIGHHGALLVGGRSSPAAAFRDCWLFKWDTSCWHQVHDLPVALYRHSVTRLAGSSLALLAGGKLSATAIFDSYLLYHPGDGWIECVVEGDDHPPPFFGGIVVCSADNSPRHATFSGILAGGLTEDGLLNDGIFSWVLNVSDIKRPSIRFSRHRNHGVRTDCSNGAALVRFGATSVWYHDMLIIVGGISQQGIIPHPREIVALPSALDARERDVCLMPRGGSVPRPLLVGASVALTPTRQILIMGGGATCFSMGTFSNKGVYTIQIEPTVRREQGLGADQRLQGPSWELSQTIEMATEDAAFRPFSHALGPAPTLRLTPIPRIDANSGEIFQECLKSCSPVVIQGLDLGECSQKWSLDYLSGRIGAGRKVVVHECRTENMDFNAKNFRYVTKDFGDFTREVKNGGRLYMRALSQEKPADKPTVLEEDYPSIAPDFVLPPQLAPVASRLFSSVLRISGPVNMWLHYDVMANVYCQVTGSKRFILFPPSDVTRLSFSPGASSSSVDVFSSLESTLLLGTRPYEAVLSPGDVLFIPSLWLHTASPESPASVAVNVFFRHLDAGYATGRDVYGNRDLAVYDKGRQEIEKIAKAFDNVHADAREFYIRRLAGELLSRSRD